jgi:hypothetical protein
MKKFALISMLIIVLQSGLHAGDDFKAQSRSQITEFLKHYQPSGPQNPLRTFDAWIEKIMRADDTQWVPLAKELLDNLKITKDVIISLKSQMYPNQEYATNRSSLLQSHIDFLINQHKQQFLALNKRFTVTKDTLEEANKELYNNIVSELVPPTEQYIKKHKDEAFKRNVDTIIKEIIKVPKAAIITEINFTLFQNALNTALTNLHKTQGYIDLLDAKGAAGLKEEFKKRPEDWQGTIAKKLGYRIDPTLTLLRTQHKQLQIIRDAYIAIIEKLLGRTLGDAQKTSIKHQKQMFEDLKEKRDIENSQLLKIKHSARESLGL